MDSRGKSALLRSTGVLALLGAPLASPVAAQVTYCASVGSNGAPGHGTEGAISADGLCVAFTSYASHLPGGTNDRFDIFLRNLPGGTTERVSVGSMGVHANSHSGDPSISIDGRYVAFFSAATNLDAAPDTNGCVDVFVRDRQLQTTERVTLDSSEVEANADCWRPAISGDGRFVVFHTFATNLVGGDTNAASDIFVRDRQLGTTERVSVASSGAQANDHSLGPSISWDGRFVAFYSLATNLVGGDTNLTIDVFVRDRELGTTERVSVDSSGAQAIKGSSPLNPPYRSSISANGRFVSFESATPNLVGDDTNTSWDVFVRDRLLGRTERASVDSAGEEGHGPSWESSISGDGRSVAFRSYASDLVVGDTNAASDIFIRDRGLGVTERASVHTSGAEGNSPSFRPSMSADGRRTTFYSSASNLVDGDTGYLPTVFVRERPVGPSFTSLCDPGVDGVIPCPCANPPGGRVRGCENSSGTGGARLTAAGSAYLSGDNLVFTTSAQTPHELSILVQGNEPAMSGIVYGQGVRCAAGSLERLFTKVASGGSVTAPDFMAFDPSVSERSAALGDTILPGESRWYFVYYRDPIVLGGCPATSTFNATQTGEVAWSP